MSDSLSPASARWTLRLTDLGKQTLCATTLVLLASLLLPAFGALCTLVCLQVIGLAIALALRPRVSLFCDVPGRLVVGQEAAIRLQIRNDSNRPIYDLVCGLESLPQPWQPEGGMRAIESLAPRQSMEWSYKLVPLRRGRHPVGGAVCRSSFPLNLVSLGRVLSTGQPLLVLPAFHDLDTFALDPGAGQGGSRLRRIGRGGSYPEYMGNRPYIPGDPPRRIDARAWARLSVPAVREFQETSTPSVGLFLDTHVTHPGDADADDAFEAAVSLSASLAYSARRSCVINWFAAGTQVHAMDEVPATERFDRIHEVLAEVEPAGPRALQDAGDAMDAHFGTVSAVLFVLLSWDSLQRQRVERARDAGCQPLVLVVASQADVAPEPDGLEVLWVSPLQAREGQVRL